MPTPKVDIIVNLLSALQPLAGGATTLPLNDVNYDLDYSRLIGNLVVNNKEDIDQLTSSLNALYSSFTTLNTQVTTLIANGLTVPQITLPVIMGDSNYYNIEVVVAAIGNQLNTLRDATGNSENILGVLNYQDVIYRDTGSVLKSQTAFTSPSELSALSDWIGDPTYLSDNIKNMWVTLNDLRIAFASKFATVSYANCTAAAININFNTYVDIPNNRITLYFVGLCNLPSGFKDVNSLGAGLRITDGSSTPNVYNTYVNVSQAVNNVNGITIDLSGTNINLFTNLTLLLTYNFTDGVLVCGSSVSRSVTASYSPCVALTLTPLSTTAFTGVFTPSVSGRNVNYTVTTYTNSDCSTAVVGSAVLYTNPTASQLTYNLTGLTTGTTYYVRMSVTIGSLATSNCSLIQSVKTL